MPSCAPPAAHQAGRGRGVAQRVAVGGPLYHRRIARFIARNSVDGVPPPAGQAWSGTALLFENPASQPRTRSPHVGGSGVQAAAAAPLQATVRLVWPHVLLAVDGAAGAGALPRARQGDARVGSGDPAEARAGGGRTARGGSYRRILSSQRLLHRSSRAWRRAAWRPTSTVGTRHADPACLNGSIAVFPWLGAASASRATATVAARRRGRAAGAI